MTENDKVEQLKNGFPGAASKMEAEHLPEQSRMLLSAHSLISGHWIDHADRPLDLGDRLLDLAARRLDLAGPRNLAGDGIYDIFRDARQGNEKRAAHRKRLASAGDVQHFPVVRKAALHMRLRRRVGIPAIVPSIASPSIAVAPVAAAARARGRKSPNALRYGRPSLRELLQRPPVVAQPMAACLDGLTSRDFCNALATAKSSTDDTWLGATLWVTLPRVVIPVSSCKHRRWFEA